jgi:formimidoylglutamate deiminase
MTTLWAAQALTAEGWTNSVRVTIDRAGRIAAVDQAAPAPADRRVGILLPAPANAHSHAFQRAMAGLTERRGPDPRDTFWTWRALMFRFLDRLTPAHVEAIAAFVQMEMLEAGYATNVEFHYLHHQPGGQPYDNPAEMAECIAAATARTGIGLTLLPVHYQFGGCDRRPLGPGQVRFGTDPDAFARLHAASAAALAGLPGDTRLGFAPHSLRAVDPGPCPASPRSPPTARSTCTLPSRRRRWPRSRPRSAAARSNTCSTVSRPTDATPSSTAPRWSRTRPRGLPGPGRRPGSVRSLNRTLATASSTACGGWRRGAASPSDRIPTSASRSPRNCGRSNTPSASATGRGPRSPRPEKSTGRRLFDAVLAGGAAAAGRETGAIHPGLYADLVVLDGDHVDMDGLRGDAILDSFVFGGDDRLVRDVWSAGRHVVTEGRHIARDGIVAAYRAALRDLREAL